jgi:multiple sugar transport system substrate-binding protein
MSRRRFLIGLAGVLAAPAILPARAQQARPLRVIGPTGAAVKALSETLIPEFQKRTGQPVDANFMAYEGLTQKVMTEFVAGSPSFDVIMFETSWGGKYSPFLQDLEPFVQQDKASYAPDDILHAARQMGVYQSKTVGVPYRVIGRMLHYRKDLFEAAGLKQPPQTLPQLLEYAQKLTRTGGPDEVYGLGLLGKQGFGNAYEFGSFLFSSGGAWWDLPKCQVLIDDEIGQRTMQFYAELRNKHHVVPPEVTTWGWDEWMAGAQNGRYAMSIMHTVYAIPIADPKQSKTAGKWAWAEAPGWSGMAQSAPPVGGWLFGLAGAGAHHPAGWDFVKFVTGAEAQLMSAFNANAPTRASTFSDAKVRAMWPWADVALLSLQHGTPMYNNPEEMPAESALMVTVSQALLGGTDPIAIAKDSGRQLRGILHDSGRC